MATKLQRYEAVVKLSTGEAVVYHNINTGLIKFHNFVCQKFNSSQVWEFYKVRRIETKEEIGTFVNATEDKQIKAIKIYSKTEPNSTGTGIILGLPFVRAGYTIWRNVFVANSQILERNNDFLIISEWLLGKIIKQAKKGLFDFYTERQHQITSENEFEFGDEVECEKVIITKRGRLGTAPQVAFP